MATSAIVFSAQFGGRDAAAAVLPHFRALKAAAQGLPLFGFPFAELAFILRVDGEVNSYGLSGAGDLVIDKDGKYIAIDIGITQEDQSHLANEIRAAILSGVERLAEHKDSATWDIDYQAMRHSLKNLCNRYDKVLTP